MENEVKTEIAQGRGIGAAEISELDFLAKKYLESLALPCHVCGKMVGAEDGIVMHLSVKAVGLGGMIEQRFKTAFCEEHADKAFEFAKSPFTRTLKRNNKQAEADDGDTTEE